MAFLLSLCFVTSSVGARSLLNYGQKFEDNPETIDAGPAENLDPSNSDHRQLQTCALNMQWTTTHNYSTFYYEKCTGSYTIAFSPFTYNSACTAPDPDPNLYTNLYTLTQVDPCTTPGISTTCTFQINTDQTMFDTNGYSITFNTCDIKSKTNYAYKVEYFYRGSDATFIKDGFQIVLQACDTCVWSSITAASTSLGHIYHPNDSVTINYNYDAILTQNPDCGYIESDYNYYGRMTNLINPSNYDFYFESSSFLIDKPNLSVSTLPKTYDLQWWVKPSNFCPSTYLSPTWVTHYVDFKVTIYCKLDTLSVSSFSTSYTAYVSTNYNIPYPTDSQSPSCNYPLEVTSYSINTVASATKSWFVFDDVNQRLQISSSTGLDVGSYTISITFGARDTKGDYMYRSVSSFTLTIKCVLSSVTSSFTMDPSYSANILNAVSTITAPTFIQTPDCNIVPVFTQKVNGVATSPGTWLTSATSIQTLIMPTKAADDGTYAFVNTWKFTDSSGLIKTLIQSHNVVIDVCSGATYSVPSMSDLILFYQGVAVSYAWTNFQDSVAIATAVVNACGVWSYTWAPTGLLATDVTVTTVTANNFSFRWVNGLLSDFTQALPYASTLNGYQNGILKSSVTFNTYFYCKVTTFTATSAATAYSASVGSQTIVPFPTFTQAPNCGLTVSLQSYTVNSVSNPSYTWLTTQTSQFAVNPTSYADVGVYVFVITWKITDTQGTITTSTSTFTVTISCVLVSVTPSSSMAATYTSNALLSPYTITFPTFVQTPACGYVPVFQYSLNAVVAKTATWLTATSTNEMQVTPKSGLDDGTYTMAVQWTFTDQLGAQTLLTDSFTVVIDVCSGATYQVPTMSNVTLAFQGLAANLVWTNFVDSVSQSSGVANSCGKWTYSWTPPSNGNIASAVTKTNVAANAFSYDWTSGVLADFDLGTAYPNTIKGYLNGVYKTSANFNMYFTCKLTSVTKIQDSPQLVEYTIGGNPLAIPLSVYIQTPSCELDAVQSLSVNFAAVIPSWLTTSSTQIVVNSVNAKDDGVQYVIVQQIFSDGFGFVYNDTDTIVVVMTRPNTAPYFITPPTAVFTITHGRDWQYELPKSTDDEDDPIVVDCDLPNIVTFSSNTLSISGGLTNTTEGPLQIGVTLTDPDGASSNYAIRLEFESTKQNKTVVPTIRNETNVTKSPIKVFNKTAKPVDVVIKVPHPEIQSIKQTGIVTLTFDQDLVPIKVDLLNEATIEVNGQIVPALQLSIQPGYYSDIGMLKFNYTVTAFTARKLTLLLRFENPNYVSNEQADPDLLKISFNDVTYFFTQFAETVESGTYLLGKLPRIFQGQVSAQFVDGMNSLSQSSSYLIGGNMAMNIMLAASLNQLWAMVQTQQIIVLMPLFAINMPQNAQLFFGFIMQIASFDILPTDSFYDEFFDIAETEAINQSFDNLGFNSMFFLYNMGSLSIAWFVIPVLIIVGALLKCCKPLSNKIAKLKSLHQWIDNFIFWNYPIGTFNNSASIIYMCSLINLMNLDFSTRGCQVSTAMAIVSIAVALILPLIFTFVMVKNRFLLNHTAFKDSLGAMYEGLNTKRPGVALLPLFFFVRRFILALIVIFNDHIVWQLLAMHLMFLTQIAIMGFVKPFETPRQALTEYMNEVLIILMTYCMILFTDFNDDFDSQIQIGYVCCSFVALHLFTNIAIMLSESCRGLKMRVIRFKNRKNIRQVVHTNKRRFQKDKDAPVKFRRPPIVSTVTETEAKLVPSNPVQQHVTFAQLIVPDEGFTFVKRERKVSSFGMVGSIKSSLQLPSIKESDEDEERKESISDVVSELEKEMREIYDNPRPVYNPAKALHLCGGKMGSVTSLLDRVLVSKPQSMASIVTPQNKKEKPEDNEFLRWAKNHQMPGSIDTVDKQIQEANQRILDRNTANVNKKFSFTKISESKVAFTQKQLMMFKPEL